MKGPAPKVDDTTIRQMLASGMTVWEVEAVLGYADGALYQRKCVREFRGLGPYKRDRMTVLHSLRKAAEH